MYSVVLNTGHSIVTSAEKASSGGGGGVVPQSGFPQVPSSQMLQKSVQPGSPGPKDNGSSASAVSNGIAQFNYSQTSSMKHSFPRQRVVYFIEPLQPLDLFS